MCGYSNIPVCLQFTPARKTRPNIRFDSTLFLHKEWRQKRHAKKKDYNHTY